MIGQEDSHYCVIVVNKAEQWYFNLVVILQSALSIYENYHGFLNRKTRWRPFPS